MTLLSGTVMGTMSGGIKVAYDDISAALSDDPARDTFAYNDANELTKQIANGIQSAYTYDDWGRTTTKVTADTTEEYLYFAGSKLKTYKRGGAAVAHYNYDGFGKRRNKVDVSTTKTTWWRYDMGWNAIVEYDDADNDWDVETRKSSHIFGDGILAIINGVNATQGDFYYNIATSFYPNFYNSTNLQSSHNIKHDKIVSLGLSGFHLTKPTINLRPLKKADATPEWNMVRIDGFVRIKFNDIYNRCPDSSLCGDSYKIKLKQWVNSVANNDPVWNFFNSGWHVDCKIFHWQCENGKCDELCPWYPYQNGNSNSASLTDEPGMPVGHPGVQYFADEAWCVRNSDGGAWPIHTHRFLWHAITSETSEGEQVIQVYEGHPSYVD